MRKAIMIPALIAASLSLSAMADDEYYDTARVLSVTPQTERVNYPRQECSTEYVRESYTSPDRSPAGAIIGGIAGGLLGSQIGKGNGRVAGAAVGAGVGAVVGDRIGSNQTTTYGTRPVDRCVSVDNWQMVNRGYLVAYRYNGRDYSTVMDRDPGDTIRIHVSVGVAPGGERISYLDPASRAMVYPAPAYRRYSGNPRGWDRGRGWDGDHDWDDDRHHRDD